MLEINNVTKTYGETIKYQALKGINLTVNEGEFVGVMGPSGSGKSTLLNLIGTIDKPTSGTVSLDGFEPAKLNQEQLAKFRRNQLGFVFQSFNLMPTLTVEENIVLPLTLDGEKVSVMKKKLHEVSATLGIDSLLKKRIATISGGQAQRVAIARAMIHQPKLLLADEPTGNLDTKSSKDVMGLLSDLNQEEKSTILMVTHDPFAASYCEKIIFIKDGELVQQIQRNGSRSEFYDVILESLRELEGVSDEI
ncbi:ABC transporter ATP-binding protein [Vagococcus carniphilus]|uniref:ABC transporter ATP-binding protein n=1 Tax=Vagococcus carniphilus TaxID=218144 RepID=UPI0028917B0F|nr:ABC transporter ATP-binding protein [Vagococcus carniphilus]MDT2814310.1 ABC transporter ATP-binding protein [Vagococcus carniphilus]MDT2829429.1 ABC transporter ATP-binding protein [Vagococcus carniphilus]MDT2847822.1 ABC transporter ATP-binding protein [Vagococcus carniphilus]MDT2852946.1 ABC transporter ATP-binding protein [Vagococcus carniphilus]MDT2864497.1 ABC transporter ATP-binding protein [Vagococcus carniphilus]